MAGTPQALPEFLRLAGHPLRWQAMTELAHSDLRVRELVTLLGQPQNVVSYHLRLLRDGGLVRTTRSSFDGRDSYYHLDLDRCADALARTGAALHPAVLRPSAASPSGAVLFVCTGNSARSPIAEALLRKRTSGRVETASAGTAPRATMHPVATEVLRHRYDVDIAGQQPIHVAALGRRRFDYLVTLCDKAREHCSDLGDHPRRIHWSIPDPAAAGAGKRATTAAFLRTAADIDNRVRHLVSVLDVPHPKEVSP